MIDLCLFPLKKNGQRSGHEKDHAKTRKKPGLKLEARFEHAAIVGVVKGASAKKERHCTGEDEGQGEETCKEELDSWRHLPDG